MEVKLHEFLTSASNGDLTGPYIRSRRGVLNGGISSREWDCSWAAISVTQRASLAYTRDPVLRLKVSSSTESCATYRNFGQRRTSYTTVVS